LSFRRGRVREGDKVVFQCGRNILRGIIIREEKVVYQMFSDEAITRTSFPLLTF